MAKTTAEIVKLPYDEAVIECIKTYHAIPTVQVMLTGLSKDITDPLIVNKLHNAQASQILNASSKILSSVKLPKNFSMSPELANAIGSVVVQALQENAKETLGGVNDSELDSEDTEDGLPKSDRDLGLVEGEEGPKYAPDLSAEVDELKNINNHSETTRYDNIKNLLNFDNRIR